MIAAMQTLCDCWKERRQQFEGVRLEGLKIKGDKATAKVRFSDGYKEEIEFRRLMSAWILRFPVPLSSRY
jgi:hypothetical protein